MKNNTEYVDINEKVTAIYPEEHDVFVTTKTIGKILNEVCDDYTVVSKDEIIGYAIDKYKNDLINEITKQVEVVFKHHGYIPTASEVIKLIKEFNGGEYK